MPDRREQLDTLRLELLRGGVAPHYVERTILELDEHCEDLERDALAAGFTADAAAGAALNPSCASGAIVGRAPRGACAPRPR